MWRSPVARAAGGREVAGSSPVIPTTKLEIMNQRIAVRSIIKQDDRVLLLRRSLGRESIVGQYELPGGRLDYNEQPEDTLRRHLHDDVGLHISKASLFDVVTYIDKDDRNIQYAVAVYTVVLAGGHHELHLGDKYDQYIWQSMTDIQHSSLTDLTQLLLGIIHQDELTDGTMNKVDLNDDKSTTISDAIIYTDGGSRGNPGPSASGYVIMDNEQQILAQGGEYLGITTNNQAEYQGVRLGLEKASDLGLKSVEFRLDSTLVVNQMNGIYTIKNRELWPINERIRGLISNFDHVGFRHVPRELNQLADGEVNRCLDAHQSSNHNV